MGQLKIIRGLTRATYYYVHFVHLQIKKTYDAREEAVKQCISYTQQKIQAARESEDSSILRQSQLKVS